MKQELKEAVEWPLKYPDVFERLQTKPPKGILMFGPPGTGKTLLAKAVANESECNFIAVKGPELLSKWVGESEKGVREIFRKARQASPAIIFFDEIDALVPKRGSFQGSSHVTESVVSQILTELDGMEELKNVTILAATNRPDMLDDALLRPGRLERHIYVPAPDAESRKKIFEVYLGGETASILAKEVDIDALVGQTEGYVGADIEALVREAKMAAMRDFIIQMGGRNEQERKDAIKNVMLTKAHFDAAVLRVKGSLDQEAIEKSERQAWEMLYNQEQRTILDKASMLITRAGMAHRKAEDKTGRGSPHGSLCTEEGLCGDQETDRVPGKETGESHKEALTMHEDPLDMFEEMDEMFARLFERMDREFMAGSLHVSGYRIVIGNDGARGGTQEIPAPLSRATREPVAEVHRIGDEILVVTELPGVTVEMIRLDLNGNTLVIDAGEAENHYRTIATLPPVDVASMQRSFKNGVLEVSFRNPSGAAGEPEPGTQ